MFKKLTIKKLGLVVLLFQLGSLVASESPGVAGEPKGTPIKTIQTFLKKCQDKLNRYSTLDEKERGLLKNQITVLGQKLKDNPLKTDFEELAQRLALLEAEEAAKVKEDKSEKGKPEEKELKKSDESKKGDDLKKDRPNWFSTMFTLRKAGLFTIGTLLVYGCVQFFKKPRSSKPQGNKGA